MDYVNNMLEHMDVEYDVEFDDELLGDHGMRILTYFNMFLLTSS